MIGRVFLFLGLLAFSATGWADRVGNGGGFAEQNFVQAEQTFKVNLEAFLATSKRSTKSPEIILVQKLLASWAQERLAFPASQIKFLSGKLNPDIFSEPDSQRIWATNAEIGSPIYINTDLINSKKNGLPVPISVNEAFYVLFISYGWHQKNFDEFYLDGLARAIAKRPYWTFYGYNQDFLRDDYVSAEFWLSFLFAKLPSILQFCLQNQDCLPDIDQRQVIQTILQNMSAELNFKNGLRFESGLKKPELFMIDGQIKAAVTGLKVGDPIYFNLDFLYHLKNNRLNPISVYPMLSMLIHELGHHASIQDHSFLDLIANQLSSFFQNHHNYVEFNEDPQMGFDHETVNFKLHILEYPSSQNTDFQLRPNIFMTDSLHVFDFNSYFEPLLACPKSFHLKNYRVNEMQWTGQTIWSNEYRRVLYNGEGQKWIQVQPLIYILTVDATILCVDQQGQNKISSFKSDLKLFYTREYQVISNQFHTPTGFWVFEKIAN